MGHGPNRIHPAFRFYGQSFDSLPGQITVDQFFIPTCAENVLPDSAYVHFGKVDTLLAGTVVIGFDCAKKSPVQTRVGCVE